MANTGSQQSFMPEVEDMLTCQVCLTSLIERSPRQLRCLHTFCTPCLEKILTKVDGDGNCISCPTCRETTQLSHGKVKDLPLNFTVKQMKEVVQSLSRVECCNTCWAKGDFVNAATKCVTCNRRLCDACCTRHHKFPGFDSHPMESLRGNLAKFDSDCCKNHSSEYVHFCAECKSLVCTDCLLSGEHDSHPSSLKGISETAKEARNQITQTQSIIKQQITKRTEDLDQNAEQDQHLQGVRLNIVNAAEEMLKSIAEQRDLLLQELQSEYITHAEQNAALLRKALFEKNEIYQRLEKCGGRSDCDLLSNQEIWSEKGSTVNENEDGIKFTKTVHFIEPSKPIFGKLVSSNTLSNTPSTNQTPASATEYNILPSPISITGKPKLLYRFQSNNIDNIGGIGALSNGCAVMLARNKKGFVLCNSNTGATSTISASRNVRRVSTYQDKILCCNENTIFEIDVSANTFKLVKEFKIPDALSSYLTYDSSCNVLITHVEGESSVRKYGQKNDMLWKKYINTNNYIRICVAGNHKNDMYVISFGSEVEVWDRSGHTVHKLNIVKRKQKRNLRGITITPAGTILVADRNNNTISEYGIDGSFIRDLLTENDGIRNPRTSLVMPADTCGSLKCLLNIGQLFSKFINRL